MSVELESRVLRSLLHGLVDGLVDEIEKGIKADANQPSRLAAIRPVAGKPPIRLEEPTKKPQRRGGRQARGEVLVGCGLRAKQCTVILRLAGPIASRAGLGPDAACDCSVQQVGKTLIVHSGRGVRARRPPGGQQYLVKLATGPRWGRLDSHRSEACLWHFDLQDRLVIQAPAWLPPAIAPSEKQRTKEPKDALPVSCKKLTDRTPPLKCSTCGKRATVQCSRCEKLICDACWESHVRTHWHTEHHGKAGTAARDARQAMRSDA